MKIDKKEKCPHCNGTGRAYETRFRPMVMGKIVTQVPRQEQTRCRYCNGTGKK